MLTRSELQSSPQTGRMGGILKIEMHMNDSEFAQLVKTAFSRLQQGLEDADLDFEEPSDGIIEIEFDDDSKIVINRHNVAREIWVAARSGGFHFRHDGKVWRDTRDNTELFAKLTGLIAAQGDCIVDFGTGQEP